MNNITLTHLKALELKGEAEVVAQLDYITKLISVAARHEVSAFLSILVFYGGPHYGKLLKAATKRKEKLANQKNYQPKGRSQPNLLSYEKLKGNLISCFQRLDRLDEAELLIQLDSLARVISLADYKDAQLISGLLTFYEGIYRQSFDYLVLERQIELKPALAYQYQIQKRRIRPSNPCAHVWNGNKPSFWSYFPFWQSKEQEKPLQFGSEEQTRSHSRQKTSHPQDQCMIVEHKLSRLDLLKQQKQREWFPKQVQKRQQQDFQSENTDVNVNGKSKKNDLNDYFLYITFAYFIRTYYYLLSFNFTFYYKSIPKYIHLSRSKTS